MCAPVPLSIQNLLRTLLETAVNEHRAGNFLLTGHFGRLTMAVDV